MKSRQLFVVLFLFLFSFATASGQDSKQKLNEQLWEAARSGDAVAVAALLDKGADVNAKFRYGTTALFKASERGHAEVVKLLLARGADVTVKDTFYGSTAMNWALDGEHLEVIKALMEKDSASIGDVLMTGVRGAKVVLVEMALAKGGVKAETLTSALVTAEGDKEKAAIAEMLKKAGAVPPMELDAATLQSYVGRYKPESGNEIVFALQEGKLVATPTGQRPIVVFPLDKVTFKPVAFEGLTVTFTVEGDKTSGFTLKQGPTTTVYKKVEQP